MITTQNLGKGLGLTDKQIEYFEINYWNSICKKSIAYGRGRGHPFLDQTGYNLLKKYAMQIKGL